jgi:hypothetical protein
MRVMPEIVLTLTAAEQLMLDYTVERRNAARAAQRDDQDQPLPALTAAQVAATILMADLQGRLDDLRAQTQETVDTLRLLTPGQRAAFVAALPAGAKKTFLQARLQGGT